MRSAVLNLVFFLLGAAICYVLLTSIEQREGKQGPALKPKEHFAAKKKASKAAPPKAETNITPNKEKSIADEARALVASISVPADRKGSGKITGEVRKEKGEGLSGVLITAIPRDLPPIESQSWPEQGIERDVLWLIAQKKWQAAGKRKVRTNPDGTFSIEGLREDVTYRVVAELEGYEITAESTQDAWRTRCGTHLIFIAKPKISLPVTVLLPDGTQPKSAKVWIKENHSATRERWSPKESTLELDPGKYSIFAEASVKESEFKSEEVVVELREEKAPEPLTLQLKPILAIKGKVIFPPGQVPDSAYVYRVEASANERPSITQLRDRGDYTITAGDSRYRFVGLTPGTYYVAALWTKYGPIAAEAFVEVRDGTVIQDLKVPPLEPGQYLKLWVYGPDDKLLDPQSFSVDLQCNDYFVPGSVEITTMEAEDGSLLVVLPDREAIACADESADWCLVVLTESYGMEKVRFSREMDREITIHFAPPASLKVIVDGYVQGDIESRVEVALRRRGVPGDVSRAELKHRPEVEFRPLKPGDYIVELRFNLFLVIESRMVSLRPGGNKVVIALVPLPDLVVYVEGAREGTNLALLKRGTYVALKKVDREGKVVFSNLLLPPGRYQLLMEGPKGGVMPIDLPGPREIRFQPKPFNALSVTINDPDCYLAKAGLRTGDLIIGIGNTEFEDELQIFAAFASNMMQDKVELLVIRDGRRFKVAINPKKLNILRPSGYVLIPASRQ